MAEEVRGTGSGTRIDRRLVLHACSHSKAFSNSPAPTLIEYHEPYCHAPSKQASKRTPPSALRQRSARPHRPRLPAQKLGRPGRRPTRPARARVQSASSVQTHGDARRPAGGLVLPVLRGGRQRPAKTSNGRPHLPAASPAARVVPPLLSVRCGRVLSILPVSCPCCVFDVSRPPTTIRAYIHTPTIDRPVATARIHTARAHC